VKKVADGGARTAGRALRRPIACDKAARLDAARREVAMSDRLARGFIRRFADRFGTVLLATAIVAGAAHYAGAEDIPRFQVDPFWPKPLPGDWILGQVAGVAVDKNDHIWIIHRPSTLVDDEKEAMKTPPTSRCCHPAPPVLEFDVDGNLLRHWGGPGQGYDWPKQEHGILVDNDGNVWLAGNDNADNQILKFTADGQFLQQIGHAGVTGGSNATDQLGRPAHMVIDEAAGELYVADGYRNRRVIVLDAKTGAYKRHWGAYGNKPSDDKMPPYDPAAAPPQQFSNPVHCVRLSQDGLVYVCDRANDRIQIFHKDGSFVKEFRIEPQTLANGSLWDVVISNDPQQRYLFVVDGANNQAIVVARETGEVLSRFGRPGRMAGEFKWVHNVAIDSKGNLYTTEVGWGRRAQKFNRLN
jgi:DNA-binding beta-propeller fold protein YncE